MRKWANLRLRAAVIALCCVCVALGLAAIAVGFSARGPSRTLRPILSYADSAYLPLYIGMSGAGLIIAAGIAGIAGALIGNRGVDLGVCLTLLAAAGLGVGSLALAGSIKGSAQTSLESALSASLLHYGRPDPAVYDAWNELQSDSACCAVRTNMAQQAYEKTPWYQEMRQGNPYAVPKIPQFCCTKAARADPSQLADCTNNKPTLPAQNPYMNPVGCFEAMSALLDAYTTRFLIVGIVVFIGAGAALVALAYGLVVSARRGGTGGSSTLPASGKGPDSLKLGNSRPGSVSGAASVAGGGKQPLMSQPLKSGSSVYSSRHSLFSEPAPQMPRHPSESSLPSVAARSLFSEPPQPTAIQAQPMRPRPQQQQQQQQQRPVPKPRSSVAGSLAAPSEASLGTLSGGMSQASQPPQPQPQPQPLQAQPMKKPQSQKPQQQPIVLSAQPLRSQPPSGRRQQQQPVHKR